MNNITRDIYTKGQPADLKRLLMKRNSFRRPLLNMRCNSVLQYSLEKRKLTVQDLKDTRMELNNMIRILTEAMAAHEWTVDNVNIADIQSLQSTIHSTLKNFQKINVLQLNINASDNSLAYLSKPEESYNFLTIYFSTLLSYEKVENLIKKSLTVIDSLYGLLNYQINAQHSLGCIPLNQDSFKQLKLLICILEEDIKLDDCGLEISASKNEYLEKIKTHYKTWLRIHTFLTLFPVPSVLSSNLKKQMYGWFEDLRDESLKSIILASLSE
ncbi:Schizosaccharomyces specific protein Meu43 [Schizosaccharomyces pombe]|uniref:Meiotically up-regulated gene 43 protein n=1 Tax=Schizosaccharomyces pombe (strain 972 / ATCC 24843) TaxID=284812 RepID=MUG43_SCHPO|nr:uncharacterized protein SPAC6C3.05 [Schizosaccharomyces pombe]Q10308.1 RecName: Full=Meiotically up-regulated gene 43 protein [Schizosaccharomyces pombe 972h-]CAB40280.1 sequence orphan [Schizosaccharomyces pombe]|eukprot:NP_593719.1 uncharacterized protein SPAC6C3.05 [Schizosaccharomyces pombe]